MGSSFVYDDSLFEGLDPGVNVDSNGIDTMNAIAIGEDGTVVPLITITSGFGFALGTSCPLQTYYYSFNALLNT